MRITFLGFESNIQVFETGIRTSKAIQVKAYWSGNNRMKQVIWIPNSQIESRNYCDEIQDECIDVSDWYFKTVLKGDLLCPKDLR